ncbi:hypothetical protein PG990_015136 [Apiospora arundinis]
MCRLVIFVGSCIKCGGYFTWDDLTQELPCLEAKNTGIFGYCLRGAFTDQHQSDQECDACACAKDQDEGFSELNTTTYSVTGSTSGKKSQSLADNDYLGSPISGCFTGDSLALSSSDPRLADHMRYLVDHLSSELMAKHLDEAVVLHLGSVMPKLLRAFALGLGQDASSSLHRDVMVFIHKSDKLIATRFEEQNIERSNELSGEEPGAHPNMALDRWLGFSDEDGYEELPAVHHGDSSDPSIAEDEFRILEMEQYVNVVFQHRTYRWLVAQLQREILLSRANPDTLDTIRDEILRLAPLNGHVTRRKAPVSVCVTYMVQWDIMKFFRGQEYKIPNHKAISGAVILTGSYIDAQAVTCFDYMSQTWPLTGPRTLELVQQLVQTPGETIQFEVSEPCILELTANMRYGALEVQVVGLADFVAEIGEQLSWMGAALQLSPSETQITECTPKTSLSKSSGDGPSDIHCKISFEAASYPKASGSTKGQCWHRLFSRPVVANGFPIPRRPRPNTGLEMSLPLIAALSRARYVNSFRSKTVLKGFSTMLVPTGISEGVVYWHMMTSKHIDQRISYLDCDAEVADVLKSEVASARHILGWCEEAIVDIGTHTANYKVHRSQLPRAKTNCALEKIEVTGGQFITGTAGFVLGRREKPACITRHGYFRKLQWIASKYIVFWDDEEKRGWLVNGASALLHLLRAHLASCQETFGSEFLMKPGDLVVDGNGGTMDAMGALRTLTNKENRALGLYMDKTEVSSSKKGNGNSGISVTENYYCLQDEVEQIYNTLEILIDYQAEVESRSGLKIDFRPRQYLDGWDFRDIVADGDPMYPRVATLGYFGKGWVDLIRSLRAITIFGKGFGELIRPRPLLSSSGNQGGCPWATLPRGSYYLAACMSDIRGIVERHDGDTAVNPVQICDDLLWPVKPSTFQSCPCGTGKSNLGVGRHCEPVQALLPPSFRSKLKSKPPVSLKERGAIIFGKSRSIGWFYGDYGDPVKESNTSESIGDNGSGSLSMRDDSSTQLSPSNCSTASNPRSILAVPSSGRMASTASSPLSSTSAQSKISKGGPKLGTPTELYAGVKRDIQSSLSTAAKRMKRTG